MLTVDIVKELPDITISAKMSLDMGITVLFGSSGAGKSTIINMLAGLIKPTKGSITLNEQVLFDSERGINLPPERRDVGYIFQDGRLFPHMTVRKNLQYGMKDKGADIDEIVSILGIEGLLDRRPNTLSGGEKQRVAIGRAILSSPKILLMDEPMASLDSARKEELISYIDKIPTLFNIPIVYVSHSLDEVNRLADCVATVKDGAVVSLESN
ncbi:MAG: ATP-binding cassette domain-containing protein [Deferribacteraceae bacterium]|jgi:molybdate transport system ATP-binding protein|nr:ATP-binding cassette domain-containing protein [Deferribacteraceae bacterium]